MKDLTQGSIPKHLINMALPMMIGMFIQTLYFIVDLYFVGKLGAAALAGLSLAGNAMFLIICDLDATPSIGFLNRFINRICHFICI